MEQVPPSTIFYAWMFKFGTIPWVKFGVALQIVTLVEAILFLVAPVPGAIGKAIANVTVAWPKGAQVQSKIGARMVHVGIVRGDRLHIVLVYWCKVIVQFVIQFEVRKPLVAWWDRLDGCAGLGSVGAVFLCKAE